MWCNRQVSSGCLLYVLCACVGCVPGGIPCLIQYVTRATPVNTAGPSGGSCSLYTHQAGWLAFVIYYATCN